MRKKLHVWTVLVFLTACSARAASTFDAISLPNSELFTNGDGAEYFVYSSIPNAGDQFILVAEDTDSLIIGRSGGAAELGVSSRFGALGLQVCMDATMTVAAPVGGSAGTVLDSDFLDFRGRGLFLVESGIDATANGKNRAIIDELTATPHDNAASRFAVRENAVLEFTRPAFVSSYFSYELAGGEIAFSDSLAMECGVIEATAGNNFLAAANGLTLNRTNPFYLVPPVLRVHPGATLTLLRNLDSAERGNLALGTDATLDIRNGGVLNAGIVTFTQDHVIDPAQSGTVTADRLEFASLEDAAALAWRVNGAARFSGTYKVKGSDNSYGALDMAPGSVLTADDNAATVITLKNGTSPGEIRIDGGAVRAAPGQDFTIKGARIVLSSAPAGPILDAGTGRLDLSESSVLVDADAAGGVMAFDAARGIAVGNYEQRAGVVTATGAPSGFTVSGSAVIGGGAAVAEYRAASDATHFHNGLEVRANGVLAGAAGGGVVSLGGDLILAGGGKLDGAAGRLVLADSSGQAAIRVAGGGNRILGDVAANLPLRINADGMALGLEGGVLEVGGMVVERGGVYAAGSPATIRNSNPAGSVFRILKDGVLETTSAGLTLEGYDAVAIDGTYSAGWDGTAIAPLRADSDIILGETATIRFTGDLLANITPGADAVIMETSGAGRAITSAGDLGISSMFGSIGIGIAGGKLAVTSVDNQIKGDYRPEDIALAAANMRSIWGDRQISSELAALAYEAAVPPHRLAASPGDAGAGGRNAALLQALANPAGNAVGKSTVEYLNGAQSAGVTETALRTAAVIAGQLSDRARTVHDQFQAARDADDAVVPDGALPVAALNEDYADRFWVSGLRVWESARDGDGFSGYEYDAHGFIIGYDRAFSDNIALGASFAYNQGDYLDGGALSHASRIDACTVSAYGLYSREDGLFAMLSAGYAYSGNDIAELRNDPSSPSGVSWGAAHYNAGTLALGIDAGFDYNPCDYLTLTPSFGLLYLRSEADDHDDFLGGVATQYEQGVVGDALLFPVRLSGQYETRIGDAGRLLLTASLGYVFNAMKSGPEGVIDYYGLSRPVSAPIQGREMSRHFFNAGIGLRFMYRRFDFGLDYSFAGGSGYSTHRLSGSVGTIF